MDACRHIVGLDLVGGRFDERSVAAASPDGAEFDPGVALIKLRPVGYMPEAGLTGYIHEQFISIPQSVPHHSTVWKNAYGSYGKLGKKMGAS
jgi:hypothetical protein